MKKLLIQYIKTLKKSFNLNKLYKEYNSKYFKGKLGDVVFDVYTQGKNDKNLHICKKSSTFAAAFK